MPRTIRYSHMFGGMSIGEIGRGTVPSNGARKPLRIAALRFCHVRIPRTTSPCTSVSR